MRMSTEIQKRAVIYCRVSTKEQVEEGNSLATQEKKCKEYAMRHGYSIAEIFIEQGESAKTADRTQLKKLLAFCAVKKNNVQAIIAYKIDRISRNIDDYSQIRLHLRRYGVEIKSTSENFENNPAGRFMENIIANVAQFDNDVRAERCMGGMIDAVREGRYVWQAPTGYDNVRINGKATIAPNDQAELIREAFEALAAQNTTVEQLRYHLADQGLLSRKGTLITKSHLYRILNNELYTGWICQFGERNKGVFKPLISELLFAKVQTIIHRSSSNKLVKLPYHVVNTDFPLKSLFKTPSGNFFTGYWAQGRGKKYPYYILRKANINIRKELLEQLFKEMLNRFQIDLSLLDNFQKQYKQHVKQCDAVGTKNIEMLKRQQQELLTRQDILINKNIDGVIDDNLCKAKLTEIKARLFTIDTVIQKSNSSSESTNEMLRILRLLFSDPANLWETSSFKSKLWIQRFYFPQGIMISDTGCRTDKICNVFNVNQPFEQQFSWNVNLRKQKSNTVDSQLSLSEDKNLYTATLKSVSELVSDPELQVELAELASILEKENQNEIYKAQAA